MSLRLRFAVFAALLTIVVAAGLAVGVTISFRSSLNSALDAQISNVVSLMRSDIAGGTTGVSSLIRAANADKGPGGAALQFVGHTPAGRDIPLTGSQASIVIPASAWSAASSNQPALATVPGPGGDYRFAVIGLPNPLTVPGPGGTASIDQLAVGESRAAVTAAVSDLYRTFALIGAISLGIAVLAAWLAARIATRPLRRLAAAIDQVATEGDLSQRVRAGAGHNEISVLGRAFNATMEHIESMYRALEAVLVKQRRFVADASHELRTPLTTMSSSLEVMEQFSDMDAEQRQVIIDGALHEARRMARMVDDLLTLAGLDSGERMDHAPFDWDALLEPALVSARHACAPRSVVVDIDGPLGTGTGDVRALQQLIEILVDNVIRHTSDTATMTFHARRDTDGTVVLVVSDDGPGVADEAVESIFERFVQADPSRHGEGSGLGLAIARAIAIGHGGTLVAERNQPHGLRVTAAIPRASETPDRRRAPRPGTPAGTDVSDGP